MKRTGLLGHASLVCAAAGQGTSAALSTARDARRSRNRGQTPISTTYSQTAAGAKKN